MRHLLRKTTTVLGVSIATAVFLFTFGFVGFHHPVDALDRSGRLITIHDRGEEKVFLSEAGTVADALKDADITVDSHDAVEPALNEKLVASEYQINIYRARPVVVVDGPMRQKVVTAYQTAEQIVSDTDIELHAEDLMTVSRSEDIVSDGAGLQVVIDRATSFTLDLYGTKTKVRAQGPTVKDMLEQKGIQLEARDRASVPLSDPLVEGMNVRIWREGKQTVTREEKIKFGVQQIQDADQPVGYKKVKTPGKNGTRTVSYEIEVRDGKEVKRKEIASITKKKPVQQVEIVGIKMKLLVNFSADKAAIMTAAGISANDQQYAAYIINNENALWCPIRWQGTSGCWAEYAEKFPGAESSAGVGYGLCQSTPANKMATAGSDWRTNAVTQMKWCHGYAIGRYGSWRAAYEYKAAHGWW